MNTLAPTTAPCIDIQPRGEHIFLTVTDERASVCTALTPLRAYTLAATLGFCAHQIDPAALPDIETQAAVMQQAIEAATLPFAPEHVVYQRETLTAHLTHCVRLLKNPDAYSSEERDGILAGAQAVLEGKVQP